MPDPAFFPVTLKRRWAEAEDLYGLEVDLTGTTLAWSFEAPGQFVQVRTPKGAIAYLAISSKPGEPHFEFLVKAGGEAADELLALGEGARFEMTPAMGKGYPVQHHTGRDVLLFAVGSGISPIRSLIWYLAGRRSEYQGVTLFFGARTPAHFAYRDELEAWQKEGIDVVRVVSRPEATEGGFVRGYVQDAVAAHPIDPAKTVAFVCGMKGMVEGVASELEKLGVTRDRIFQNY